jgi:hypothetical protein
MAVTPEDTASARAREAQRAGGTEPQISGECPRCAAPTQAFQEYCLECGARLPPGHGPGAALAEGWRRRDRSGPEWVWPVLVALVVAVLAVAAVLALAASRDDPRPTLVATQEPVGPPLTATTAEAPTVTVPTLAPTPPPPTAVQTQPAPPRPGGLTPWPEDVDGYTIILASFPSSGGRAAATSRARTASDAGLAQVGVLNSNSYPSLQPGYFVVFTGVHRAERAAVQALPAAREAGFDAAYVKRIAR